MNKEKQLVKNTVIVSIGKIATQLITFLLLPLYTNMLSTEEYGVVDLLNSIVVFALPLVTLQIEQAVFRFLIDARDDVEYKKKIVTSNFVVLAIQLILFTLLYICIQNFINNQYKIFLVLNIFAHMFSSEMLQISRGLGSNKDYAISSFIISLVNVLLNVVLIAQFKIGAYGLLIANFVSNCAGGIYIFFKQKIYKFIGIKSFDLKILKEMLAYSIPLIPNALSWWVLNLSDRMAVSMFLGTGMNGIYTAANKFSSAYVTIYNIFNLTWTESISVNIDSKDNEEYINKVINVIFILFSSMCLGIIACIPFVFSILIGENFRDAYYQIPILLFGSLLYILIALISAIYVAKKMSTKLAKTTIVAAIINIIILLCLIKFIGLYAASVSTLLSYAITFIYRYIDIRKQIKIKFELKNVLLVCLATIFISITYYVNNIVLNFLGLIIIVMFCFFMNKNNFYFILKFIKRKVGKINGEQVS